MGNINLNASSSLSSPHIVVIGGGTGTFVTISGLKQHSFKLTAVISVADNGGSTGRLRDEFGFLPVGDLRQALAALADDNSHHWIRNLLLYRFAKGSGLAGHNVGNLILTALQDMTGSTPKALETAAKIFRLEGEILPSTNENVQLVIEYEDGTIEVGEKVLDSKHGGQQIVSVKTSPRAKVYEKTAAALRSADAIIIGPGDLYGSLIANLTVDGLAESISESSAKLIYVANLMTRYTQTHNLTAHDHVTRIESYLSRPLDYIVINSALIPAKIQAHYQTENEFPLTDDLGDDPRVIRAPIIKPVMVTKHAGDTLKRSYLRHDPEALANTIINCLS